MIRVGPFEIFSPIARGGMGEVWRGVHVSQRVPVAVKVLTAETARQAHYVEPFEAEVRAVAGLDHPGICTVLDYGTIDSQAEAASGGRLCGGSPWLAMELCSGGTLAALSAAPQGEAISPSRGLPATGPLDWTQTKLILLAVLDALAHAHARGVVHRDLKPSNVLIATRGDSRPGLKLSDFGIAYADVGLERTGTFEDKVYGTPMYMAPEQIRGEWRDYGPWTDLYALGGTLYRLTTGQPLFPRSNQRAMVAAHLREEPRPLDLAFETPPGFAAWVARLVAKPWQERFQRAADAAFALMRLGDVDEYERAEPESELETTLHAMRDHLGETWRLVLEQPVVEPSVETLVDVRRQAAARGDTATIGLRSTVRPTIPERWTRRVVAPAPAPLVGAGLALYGLRALPIVGREAERDTLWANLRQATGRGRARVVVIHGPAGTGKSSLAEWLCERAHEVGAANIMRAQFGPRVPPGEALRRLGAGYLHTGGLRRPDVELRVESFVRSHGGSESEVRVLSELLCPASAADIARGSQPVRLTRPSEYYTAVRDALYRLAQDRPVVVWLDDVQWGLHGLGLVLKVLKTQEERSFPVLFVLTARDEDLGERPEERERLDGLLEMPDVTDLPLGPLPAEAHSRLVRGLLRLDGALAAGVEARTGGNPLFAVQLVGDWVQRGQLKLGPKGFALADGARTRLPDDLHHVWSSRLGAVLDEFAPDARRYLEIAAVLGREVVWTEWKRACDDPEGHFGDRFPGDDALRAHLLERLRAERLAVGERRSWSFAHGMLRESLERGAEEGGTAPGYHLACAAMLADRASDPAIAERLGRHLLAGGRPAEAVEPLLFGVEVRLVTLGPGPAATLLETATQAMDAARLPEQDARRGAGVALSGRISAQAGDDGAALDALDRALELGRRFGWSQVVKRAVAARAEVRTTRGDFAGARADWEALVAMGGASASRGLVGLGRLARLGGRPAEAIELLQSATQGLKPGPDLADCAWEMAEVALELGDPAAAAKLDAALVLYERFGVGPGAAKCLVAVGALRSASGALELADAALARAQDLMAALGSDDVLDVILRRVVLAADRGDAEALRARIDEARPRLSFLTHDDRVAAALAFGAIQAAQRGDGNAVQQCIRGLREAPQCASGVDAHLMRAAASVAWQRQDRSTARVALEWAWLRWKALGRRRELREAEAAVTRLSAAR
jgi:serine/threonine protein kinase